jgi:tRNA threonylcarbamoyl adenosine modification protein YeaZ
VEREDVECVALGLGPGSYTGIRIAIALAQGWQLARGVKLLGLSSADCVAAQAHAAGWIGRLELIMDAQRHGWGCATYEIDSTGWREISPFRLFQLATDSRSHPAPRRAEAKGGANGARPLSHFSVRLRRTEREDPFEERPFCPDAAMLAQLASSRTDFVSGEALAPIYLIDAEFVKVPAPKPIS